MQAINTVAALETLREKIAHVISLVNEQKGALPSVEIPISSDLNGAQCLVVGWEEGPMIGGIKFMAIIPGIEDEPFNRISLTLVRRVMNDNQLSMVNQMTAQSGINQPGCGFPQMRYFPQGLTIPNTSIQRTAVCVLNPTEVGEATIDTAVTAAFVKFVEMNQIISVTSLSGLVIVMDENGASVSVTDPKLPGQDLFKYRSPDNQDLEFALHKAAAVALVHHKENHHLTFKQVHETKPLFFS